MLEVEQILNSLLGGCIDETIVFHIECLLFVGAIVADQNSIVGDFANNNDGLILLISI